MLILILFHILLSVGLTIVQLNTTANESESYWGNGLHG